MINIDKWNVEVDGDKTTVLSEITVLFKALMRNGYKKDEIEHAVKMSFMTSEEIKKQAEEALKEFKKFIEEEMEQIEKDVNLIGAAAYINNLPEEEQERLRKELK